MRFAALVFSVSAFGCALFACLPVHAQITCLNSHLTPSPGAGFDGDCKSVQTALKKYLLDSGYSESSAAGIMGNIEGESSYNPKLIENGKVVDDDFRAYTNGVRSSLLIKGTSNRGFGLAQWTTDGRLKNLQAYADSLSKPITSLEAQFGYLVKELNEAYKMKPEKLNAMSMEEVTWIVLRDFETPYSVACTAKPDNKCTNTVYPRHKTLTEILSSPDSYKMAVSSYKKRLSYAKAAYNMDISDCDGSDTEDEDGPYTPGSPSTPGDDPSTPPVSTGTSGALGKQSASGYYAQCKASYSGNSWRKDGSNICDSGCSLVSVANAAKYLGVSPNNPGDLAGWTQSRINNANDTGWGGSVSKLISYLNLKWNGSYLWSSYSTSTSTKVAKIRQTLASGGVVIVGGDRKNVDNTINCENSANKTAGLCVFSKNGHFVTIIGITADDKLIVANPANGRNGSNTSDKLPADNVLKFSNKAIAVYKR